MVAMVTAADGSAGTLHKTYLTVDGQKAAVLEPRLLIGWDFQRAAERIEALIPSAECVEVRPVLPDERRRELLNEL
jgi:hypothetical protein